MVEKLDLLERLPCSRKEIDLEVLTCLKARDDRLERISHNIKVYRREHQVLAAD